ncbi:hypothetical protein HMPREF0576_0788 [Mobiluncus holmesii ATCC 35242]|uniref:Uncharacterized protein n=1 Tax=Mobiluncus holmesii ATCC 35242 TaxID=887899 RepID=E6M383_9ACTO|nr:hypothetical protein HMPREF0576_0788 [Mobiluncus holmesii ATCC 35242]
MSVYRCPLIVSLSFLRFLPNIVSRFDSVFQLSDNENDSQ